MLRKHSKRLSELGRKLFFICLGSALIAFAMINVHDSAKITEGGILGLTLFLKNVFGISQTITAPLLDALCFAFAISLFGKTFLKASLLAAFSYSFFLNLFERIGPVLPNFYQLPWLASLIGGMFVGFGCSLVLTQGAASGGDDALVLVISKKSGMKMSKIFVIADVTILALSLIYIPFTRLIWSLLTTVVSSTIIGQFEVYIPKSKPIKVSAAKCKQLAKVTAH